MAITVPRYRDDAVKTIPLPGVRRTSGTTEETFGGGAVAEAPARANREFLSASLAIQEKARKQAHDLGVQQADLQLQALQQEQERATTQYRGQQALGARDTITKDWTTGAESIYQSITDPAQRAEVGLRAEARRLQLLDVVERHTNAELTQWEQDSTKAFKVNARDEGVRHAYDPQRLSIAILQQHSATRRQADNEGWSPEQLQAQLREDASGTYKAATLALVESNPELALQFMATHRADLEATDYAPLQKAAMDARQKRVKEGELMLAQQTDQTTLQGLQGLAQGTLTTNKVDQWEKSRLMTPELSTALRESITSPQTVAATSDSQTYLTLFTQAADPTAVDDAGNPVDRRQLALRAVEAVRDGKLSRADFADITNRLVADVQDQETQLLTPPTPAPPKPPSMFSRAVTMVRQAAQSLSFASPSAAAGGPALAANMIRSFLRASDQKKPAELPAIAQQVIEEHTVQVNPRRTQFVLGQVYTNANNVKGKVTGYDAQGNPTWEVVP